ncbi:MAG TPA: VWA domain-containing protein [Pyrinomonadaceae bacterium]|jgi:VWFA-related protein|nr:VWA domain-containing protein [Pyrinomonadaceae bacterium]
MRRLILVAALLLPTTALAVQTGHQIRIDVSPNAHIKVRNDFGEVTVERWTNNYVAVSATIEGSVRFTRSPIVIDNRGSSLMISVVRRPIDPVAAIHLQLKVPQNAEVSGSSVRGEIKVARDEPASQPEPAQQAQPAKQPELIGVENAKRPAGTPATEPENEEISEGDVIRVDSQLVTLNISVIDRGTNRGLMGLGQSDFHLFEDGQEQRIVQFESASAPFDMVLLIDLSGSTREVVKLIRAAALRFVEAARPNDRIAVITFAGAPAIVSELTADRELLRQRIETIDTARGDTKLYDATNFAMNEVLKQSKNSRRTAIVLMSDGLDGTIPGISGQQGSVKYSWPETLRNIQEFDGVLYTLWLNTEYEAMSPLDTQPEAFDMGHDRMKEMADAGGGVFYPVERLADLAGAYEQVVADLGTVYSLAYRPTNNARDGHWRGIRISVNRPNAVPRGKRGYYAN